MASKPGTKTPAHGLRLEDYLTAAAERLPAKVAVETLSGDGMTYGELNRLATEVTAGLQALGAGKGDRVGILLPKSMEYVAVIFGVLKGGAAYVPLDVESPSERIDAIVSDAKPRLVVTTSEFRHLYAGQDTSQLPNGLIAIRYNWADAITTPDDLAYILYTSGSTGQPKGVMLSHDNATSFVDWCSEAFSPTEHDRFSSHAPFHFDLSIFDIFVSIKHGGTLVLIGSQEGKSPALLAETISTKRISIWYSTPTTLMTMVRFGRMERHKFGNLRLVLFAGEVFPIAPLRLLRERWHQVTFYNLYGPTETNVCTYYRVPDMIDSQRDRPYPIGMPCSHCEVALTEESHDVHQGEILVAGRPVMLGYLGRDDLNDEAFLNNSKRWYRTGDIGRRLEDGNIEFIGRRDRMVKRRGYRIELGEIEAALRKHTEVSEVAVIARSTAEAVAIEAHVAWNGLNEPSLISMKQFCAEHLPLYMVPDRIIFHDALPKTSTHKLDYQTLQSQA